MALVGRLLGSALAIGVAGLAVAAVVAAPKLLQAARPSVREAMRRGYTLYVRARRAAGEFAEDFEDLVAEVQGEIRASGSAKPDEKA